MNYNTFHLKNKKMQVRPIGEHNFTYQTIISLIRKYFTNKGDVIDCGCGVGTIDFYLASRGHKVVGIDISKRAIDLANTSKKIMRQKLTEFICGDLSSYDFGSGFSYFICSEVLEHCSSDVLIVKKLYESLNDMGIGIVSAPSLNAPLYRLGLLSEFDREVGHIRRYDESTFKSLFEENGFSIVELIKTEGVLRNIIYTEHSLGWLVRILKFPLTIIFNTIDNFLVRLLGESNIYMVVRKK